MDNTVRRLWNRDFTLVVIGQITSLFGNSILRFSLSLYILKITGSAAVFGSINAVSLIPTVLLTPLGGMVADRFNRRNVMVMLDALSALLVLIFALMFIEGSDSFNIALIAVTMILLAILQSFDTPSVQSCVPILQDKRNLVKANAVVNQVSMLANIVGPVLGSFMFALIGIRIIVAASGALFFLTASLEAFIRIPYEKRKVKMKLLATVKSDFLDSLSFISKEQPIMFKIAISITALNFFAAALVTIGVPFLITTVLGMSEEYYGIALGLMAGAGIFGGVLAGVFSEKIKLSKLYAFYIVLAICLLPIGVAFFFGFAPFAIYVIIIAAVMIGQISASIVAIYLMSAVQKRTPQALIGKIMAFVNTLTMCIMPLGSLVYGILFDSFQSMLYVVVAFASVSILLTGIFSRRAFKSLD